MKRIVPFGRTYRQSDPFTLDEGQHIGLWLVRTDSTDSVGAASAEVQIKSYDGAGAADDDLWTTIHRLSTENPYYDLKGTDENTVYRVVAKANSYAAVDSSLPSGSQSRTQKAPVTSTDQTDFNNATRAVSGKVLSEAATGTQLGLYYNYQTDTNNSGVLFGAKPALSADPLADSSLAILGDTSDDSFAFALTEDVTNGGTATTDWTTYAGGTFTLASECPTGTLSVLSFPITAGDVAADGIVLTATSAAAVAMLAPGNTFFYAIAKPGQAIPSFNLGAKSGRFILDQNDFPARLSAWPFNTEDERVKLFAVEGNVLIPVRYKNGTDADLTNKYPAYAVDAPGEYEWQRSCNVAAGVYLNTGWNTP